MGGEELESAYGGSEELESAYGGSEAGVAQEI